MKRSFGTALLLTLLLTTCTKEAAPRESPGCLQGTPPTHTEMRGLLTRLTLYAPLADLTGDALAIEEQWLAMQSTGWPEESETWIGHPWTALDLVPGPNEGYTLQLQHGTWVTRHDKFLVVCNNGRWQVKQHARDLDGPWLEPARELPGQRGGLTQALVTELIKVAAHSNGPWFAQVATGNTLAWQRVRELTVARGQQPLLALKLPGAEVAITKIDETHAVVGTLPSGSHILVARVDGLWKIENDTEGGEWLPAPTADRITEPGLTFDPPYGLLLGITTKQEVQQRFGAPDEIKKGDPGEVYAYTLAKFEVRFNADGKVSAFSMRTGAPNSGVRIGSPVALWELVYGDPAHAHRYPPQELRYTAIDGKVAEITVTGKVAPDGS